MPEKVLVITRCEYCPYSRHKDGDCFCVGMLTKDPVKVNPYTIDKDCPMKDYEIL